MNIIIREIFNRNGKVTGAILIAVFNGATTVQQKFNLESIMIDYAFNVLYPKQGINIYREINSDTPSITVIKEINNLADKQVTI